MSPPRANFHPSPTHNLPPSGPYTSETYTRRTDHTPNTTQPPENEDHYILTLHTDRTHHASITRLRNRHFPAHLNKLSAHIALFRALPSSHLQTITDDIASVCSHYHSFPITVTSPFLLKRGVGINVSAEPAREIHRELKGKWGEWLSKQDRGGGGRLHYTVQNFVGEGGKREEALRDVKGSGVEGTKGEVRGLRLWRYERGYWGFVRDFEFAGGREGREEGEGEGEGIGDVA
ncbi:hypothetical protein ACLMJK_003248 [Lecanora helva]